MNTQTIPFISASLLLLSTAHAQVPKNDRKPKMNVLFIAVNDLKPELGCYGNSLIKTPNIDKLAQRGTVFLQNYCQQAISGPTRASMMTGRRPDYTKVYDLKTKMRDINPDILTIPLYFSQQGYSSSGIGKVFDTNCIDNAKYEDKPSWSVPYYHVPDSYYANDQETYQDPKTKELSRKFAEEAKAKGMTAQQIEKYVSKKVNPSVECIDIADNGYKDGALASNAIDILSELKDNKKPFFFAVGFYKPHLPFVAPKKYWDMYKRDEMPLAKFQKHAANSPDFAYHNSAELRNYSDIPSLATYTDLKITGIGLPIEKQKELIHGYYAAVSYVDAQVGKVMNALDSLGLAKNTIVVLWGDHGWHLGDHDLWCKHTNFEEATRSPLIISSPDIKSGKTNSLTEFVDVFPTLCDLSGLKIPEKLDGKSLKPIMKNNKEILKDYALSQYPRSGKMGYSIRTGNYRLTWWMPDTFSSELPFSNDLIIAKELYDYEKDPLETVSVANDAKYSEIQKDLESKMVSFFESQRAVTK